MPTIYLPSCKYTAASPNGSKRAQQYLADRYQIQTSGCCRPSHKTFTAEDTVVYSCNTCAAFCRESSKAKKIISIWKLIDEDAQFPFPDYHHQRMALQDCWRIYDNKPHQFAIRNILKKMNIAVEELNENFDQTKFCGIALYDTQPQQNAELAPKRFVENAKGFFQPHTKEEQLMLMKTHCAQIDAEEVICYCMACIAGITLGGKTSIHLLDLLFDR